MSTLSLLIHKIHPGTKSKEIHRTEETSWTEWLWCGFTFCLFLALGPFAAFPALMGALSLAGQGEEPVGR